MVGNLNTPHMLALCALLAAILPTVALGEAPSPREVAQHHWQNVAEVVAFGDVHGAYQQLHDALQTAGLIDAQGTWTGGTTHLVSLGDLLDRGDDSRKVMDLLMRLQAQAIAAGGRVHVVLGNHEVMNLTGDLRYVAAGEYAAFADQDSESAAQDPAVPSGFANHRRGFASDGYYGRWLLQLPLLVQINDSIFVHGGLPPLLAEESIPVVNERFREELGNLLRLSEPLQQAGLVNPAEDLLGQTRSLVEWLQHPDNAEADRQLVDDITQFVRITQSDLFSWQSPNWYRGTAKCAQPVEDAVLSAALAKQGAARVIVGHTPTSTRRVQQRFGDRAVLADTGMLASYYRGQASLVFIRGGSLAVQYPATASDYGDPDPIHALGRSPATIEALLADAPLPAQAPSEPFVIDSLRVVYERGNKRTNGNKVAAYRLSQLLGWNVVPVTVNRGDGVLIALPNKSITEAKRIEANVSRPNHCAVGNVYQLMYAFDALIQNEQRTADSIVYDQSDWQLFLMGHGSAFGRSSRSLPKYLQAQPRVLPGAVLERLQTLSQTQLNEALSEWLSESQIKAIMKRRDNLIRDWGPLPLTP
jgi:hypothetical protein